MSINALLTLGSSFGQAMGEGLGLMVVGMTIVFLALVVIGLIVHLAAKLMHEDEEQAAPVPAVESTPIVQATAPGDATPQLIAVLTAAATATLNRPVRIHRVRHLAPQDIQGWVYSARAGVHRQPAHRKGRP